MRTRPLTLAALGVGAVALDPRVVAWDPFPDVVGWGLIAFAAWRLSVRWTFALALVAAVASLAEAQLPYRYDAIDPISGEVVVDVQPGTAYHELIAFNDVSGARLLLLAAAVALGGIALWILLRTLAGRAVVHRDQRSARRLEGLAWAVVLGWAAPLLIRAVGQGLLGAGDFDAVWNGPWEYPAMVGIAAMVAVALVFATRSNRLWSASGDEAASPWAELMVPDEPLDDGY